MVRIICCAIAFAVVAGCTDSISTNNFQSTELVDDTITAVVSAVVKTRSIYKLIGKGIKLDTATMTYVDSFRLARQTYYDSARNVVRDTTIDRSLCSHCFDESYYKHPNPDTSFNDTDSVQQLDTTYGVRKDGFMLYPDSNSGGVSQTYYVIHNTPDSVVFFIYVKIIEVFDTSTGLPYTRFREITVGNDSVYSSIGKWFLFSKQTTIYVNSVAVDIGTSSCHFIYKYNEHNLPILYADCGSKYRIDYTYWK